MGPFLYRVNYHQRYHLMGTIASIYNIVNRLKMMTLTNHKLDWLILKINLSISTALNIFIRKNWLMTRSTKASKSKLSLTNKMVSSYQIIRGKYQ